MKLAIVLCAALLAALAGAASAAAAGDPLTWSAGYSLSGFNVNVSAVACPSATQCTAVNWSGDEVTFDPFDPSARATHQVDGVDTKLIAVACPSVTQCTALDQNGGEVTFNPQSATPNSTPHPVDPGQGAAGLACPSVSECTVVDGSFDEVTFDPQSATPNSTPHQVDTDALMAVACPSVTQCTATDFYGNEATFDPTSGVVSSHQNVASGSEATAVACPSTTQCIDVNSSGDESSFNPTSLPPSVTDYAVDSGQFLNAVACPSSTQCTAVDGSGREVTFDPTSTTPNAAATAIAGAGQLNSVACPSVDECAAVDANGSGFTGRNPAGFAKPTLSLAAPTSDTPGTGISASSISAALSGGSSPGGTITFKVFGPRSSAPSDCSGGTTVGTASASGDGTYHPSAGFTPSASGDYWWYASYGGDSNNNPSASVCGAGMAETIVARASTSLSLSAPSSGTIGGAISASSVSAMLSGGASPGGTITFTVFGPQATAPTSCGVGWEVVGTATVSGNGTYHPSGGFTPVTGAGSYWWYASYSGDAKNAVSSSTCGAGMAKTTVAPASTALSVSAPSLGTEGSLIPASSVSAVLAGGVSPGGTITFRVFGPSASAPTSCTSSWKVVGTATVSANGTYHPSAGLTPIWGPGNYWWYASYSGDANDAGANSTCGAGMAETAVAPAPTSLSVSAPSSGTAGTAISASDVSAVLAGGASPGGTVTFRVFGPQATAPTDCSSGGTTVGTASLSGDGSYHPSAGFTPTASGDYWWYASYGGDSNNGPSTSPCGASMAETVVASAGGGSGGGGGGSGGTGGTGGGTGGPSGGTGGPGSAHLGAASVSGTVVTVPVSCSSSGPCSVRLTLSVRSGHRVVIIARASVQIPAGAHTRVRLRLNRKGRALLRHHSPLHALLGLSAGGKTVASEHVTIRKLRLPR